MKQGCASVCHAALRQSGLSLVELLISMMLGLIMLSAIGYIYTGSRQSYVQQDNLARMQENGRFALELLGQEIRMAGYLGCPNIGEVTPAIQARNGPFTTLGLIGGVTPPLAGTLADSGLSAADQSLISSDSDLVPSTDLVVLHRAASSGAFLTTPMAATTAQIQVGTTPGGLRDGHKEILIISDCSQADIFCSSTVAPTDPNGGAATLSHDVACNGSNSLSKAYGTTAMVMSMETSVYYIRQNPANNPALYRRRWAPDTTGDTLRSGLEEMVENVEDMRITFGEDTDNNGSVDQYRLAGSVGNWARVRAVRVSLLIRSPDDNVASQPQPYVFDDIDSDGDVDAADTVTPIDRRMRQVYTTTISMRNRAMGGT